MFIRDCRQSFLCLSKTNDGASQFSLCRHIWLTDGAAPLWLLKGSRERGTPAGTARTSQTEEGCWLPLKNHIKLQLTKVFVKATGMLHAPLSPGKQFKKLWDMAVRPYQVPQLCPLD